MLFFKKSSFVILSVILLSVFVSISCANKVMGLGSSSSSKITNIEKPKLTDGIVVDVDQTAGTIYSFWQTKPMISPARFNSEEYRNSLDDIKSYTKNINLVRMLGGRTDYKLDWYQGLDSQGNVKADFTDAVEILKKVKLTGFKPRIVLDNVPWNMSEQKEVNTYGNANPPANYDHWQQYITGFIQAMVNAFGYDEVKTWRFRVGTEPNYNPHHWNATKEEYFKHYDMTVDAVTKIIPDVEIGPGNIMLNQSPTNWGLDIIDHCALGTNHATGKVGTPMHFICFSYYEFLGKKTVELEGFMKKIRSRLNLYPQFSNIPVDIQEFGILADENGTKGGLNDNSEYGASWYAAIADVVYKYNMSEIYDWGFGDTPRSHVVSLLQKMEDGKKISVNYNGLVEGFTGIIASEKEGRIYLLLYNHDPLRNSDVTKTLQPFVVGKSVLKNKKWIMNQWTVDREHGEYAHDLYKDCIAAGIQPIANSRLYGSTEITFGKAGVDYYNDNKAKYIKLAQLPQTIVDKSISAMDGVISLESTLSSHSVVLIELKPEEFIK